MEVTSLEFNKNDDESTRQEKNRILVSREVYYCFSSAMQELQEKGLISFEDIENLYLNPVCVNCEQEKEKCTCGNYEEGESQEQEIFEYWLVSEWFYEKLKEIKEPVIEWAGLYIWGRTCTGQAILLDSTIDNIRKLMN